MPNRSRRRFWNRGKPVEPAGGELPTYEEKAPAPKAGGFTEQVAESDPLPTADPIKAVVAMLGGVATTGRPVATELDLVAAIRAGLPTKTVRLLWKKGILSPAETYIYVLPRRTFEHREKTGRLTPEQSDRLARVLRVTALAERCFGKREMAATWLRRSTRPLDGLAPLALLDSDVGAKAVEELLSRIEHGIAA